MSEPQATDEPLAVTVVIPTHGRETRLAFALEALAEQDFDRDRFEVVVVRAPGANPPFAPAPDVLRVRFVDAAAASRPGQRNEGWRVAAGELVAFTDDDCRPDPGWLAALVSEHGRASGEEAFVQGRTVPDVDERHLLHGLARSVDVRGSGPWYETCNIAYPRALLERLAGFDEAYEHSGEDTDLALRAIAAGSEARYTEAALVRHAVVAQPLPEAVRAGWSRWESTPLLYRRHPAHRRHLFAGLFFNRTHAALLGVTAAIPLARRNPLLAAAAAAPFVADGIDTANVSLRGLARQLLHLPARLARESSVAAGLLRGAIRHRTPMV